MWFDLIKLDPKEAKEFNELGDKYAPEDMEEAALNRNMNAAGSQIRQDTKQYESARDKIQSKKNTIEPRIYGVMQRYLEMMKDNIGQYEFQQLFQALKLISRDYELFFR